MFQMFNKAIGLPFFIFSIIGIILLFYNNKNNKKELYIKSILLITSVSYYLFFIQVIRQINVRFSLPISIFISVYGAYAITYLFEYGKFNNKKICCFIIYYINPLLNLSNYFCKCKFIK